MGLDWPIIAQTLQNPNDPITGGIIGKANYLTAAICQQIHNQPAAACKTSTIRRLEVRLPR
jgi:hypothetical protein